jgi:two-component system, response regulator PdtaR
MDLLDVTGRARRVATAGDSGAHSRPPAPSVLIVEDDVLLRMATVDEFREGGFFVDEAANGDEALAMLRCSSNIDAVFSDVRMPGTIDGIGLTVWIKQHCPRIKVFLTSGTLEAFSTNHPVADGYFPKPYVTTEVERAIRRMCERDETDAAF